MLPASLSRGTEPLPLASLAPHPVNGSSSLEIDGIYDLNLPVRGSLRSILEAKAFFTIPSRFGGIAKACKNEKTA